MPRLSNGLEQIFTSLGIVGSGYKLYFFETGTTNPKTTYSDESLTVANSNPIILDAAGRPQTGIWGSDPSLYRMVLGTPDSTISTVLLNPVVDVDPVDVVDINNIAGLSPIPTAFWGTTAGTSSNYTLNPALVNIASYSNEQTFFIDFHIACAANPNIDINNIGVINLKKKTGQGTKVALLAGDVNGRHLCANDGTDIIVLDPRTPINYLGIPTSALTVTGNTITLTGNSNIYTINTSSSAQTINTISGMATGQTVTLKISSNSNSATFSSGVGNVVNPNGTNTILSTTNGEIKLYYDGTNVLITSSNSIYSNGIQLLDVKTLSSTSAAQFTSYITSAFKSYEFRFYSVIPSVSGTMFTAQLSIDSGLNWINSNYLQANTWATTSDAPAGATNKTTGLSLTGSDAISQTCSDATAGINGKFTLYNPAGTVNHQASWETFYRTDTNHYMARSYGSGCYTAATTAINAIQFLMKTANSDTTNGNLASGRIEMWGIL